MEVSIKRDGITLHGVIEVPCDTERIAIIFHGFAGDIGYNDNDNFVKISKALYSSNVASIRFDFNGHGRSDGDFNAMNPFNLLLDAFAVLDFVRKNGFKDIYVIGHSQGGVIAGMLAGYFPDKIKKLVLMAPGGTIKRETQEGRCLDARFDPENIPDNILVCNRLDVGGHYFRIMKHLPIFEVTQHFKNPALIVHGIFDDVIDCSAAVMYNEILKNATLKLYETLDHGLYGAERDEMIDTIEKFIVEEG
ncbi:MAG: alpha/beta fold hydrolase [Clostridia bacterium]|nr:alpha/beta fold hydrolase [Clostridia bacterium]